MQKDTIINLFICTQLLCEVLFSVTYLIKWLTLAQVSRSALGHLVTRFFSVHTGTTNDTQKNWSFIKLQKIFTVFYIFITVLVMVPQTPPRSSLTLGTIMLICAPFKVEFYCSSLTQWIISSKKGHHSKLHLGVYHLVALCTCYPNV